VANVNSTEALPSSVIFDERKREETFGTKLAHFWYVWRRKPFGAIGGLLIVGFIIIAAVAPLIAPYEANVFAGNVLDSPGSSHLFGTDNLGRDTLSRTIFGAQISLAAGLTASLIATIAGTCLAMLGYFGGWIDNVSQRALEILSSFPSIVLALIFIAVLGRANSTSTNLAEIAWDLRSLELAIGITFVFAVTRVLRSAVIRERSMPYIEAARSIGSPPTRILWRHILPNIMPYVIVTMSSLIGTTILIEASLSFLGYGVAPGVPSWGGDLSTRNRDYFLIAPWLLIAPGVALSLVVIGYNFFGDALRDILDPRLRGSR
jgi:peptide/nickel transport system permease protein